MLTALQHPAHLGGDPLRALAGWLAGYGLTPSATGTEPALLGARERCSLGRRTVLDGWIDNCAELAAELGLGGASPAEVHEAAVAQWGSIAAENRLIGSYAAVTLLEDGSLRLESGGIVSDRVTS